MSEGGGNGRGRKRWRVVSIMCVMGRFIGIMIPAMGLICEYVTKNRIGQGSDI